MARAVVYTAGRLSLLPPQSKSLADSLVFLDFSFSWLKSNPILNHPPLPRLDNDAPLRRPEQVCFFKHGNVFIEASPVPDMSFTVI
jgi:hypothetical protein